jgi:sulfite reductase beta subunit-like hemoprotein
MAENTNGSPFGIDADQFLLNRETGQPLSFVPLETGELLKKSEELTAEFLEGRLPDGVIREVERTSGEAAIAGGVRGPAGRRLVARDLGQTSLNLIQAGLNSAVQLTDLRTRIEQTNRETELRFAQFNEDIRRTEDSFALAARQSDQNDVNLKLQALDLQSRNRQFRISEENRLIIANSQNEIPGAQGNLDSMGGAFDAFNQQLQDIINSLQV